MRPWSSVDEACDVRPETAGLYADSVIGSNCGMLIGAPFGKLLKYCRLAGQRALLARPSDEGCQAKGV